MIFADVKEDVYKDNCCHYNKKGNEIVGTAIGKIIAKKLTSP